MFKYTIFCDMIDTMNLLFTALHHLHASPSLLDQQQLLPIECAFARPLYYRQNVVKNVVVINLPASFSRSISLTIASISDSPKF